MKTVFSQHYHILLRKILWFKAGQKKNRKDNKGKVLKNDKKSNNKSE